MAEGGFQKPTIRPRISLSGTRAAFIGPPLDLAPHKNAVATIAMALDEPFELRLMAAPPPPVLARIALIPPGADHHLRAVGPMAFLYLDALSDDHQALKEIDMTAAHSRVLKSHGQDHADTDHADTDHAVSGWSADGLCAALGIPRRGEPEPRLAAAIRAIDGAPQAFPKIEDAAGLAGLSASRFRFLFRQAVGMPFRRYRLWKRMAIVMPALAAGDSLTMAAHGAGFASSAHLSAVFKDMFGLAPSDLVALKPAFDFGDVPDRVGGAEPTSRMFDGA